MSKRNRRRGSSEGLVHQRNDGRWEGRISLGWRDGKRLRRSYYGATQAEVLDKLTKARNDVRLGLPVATDRETVEVFLTRWLEDSAKARIKPRSHERFGELIRLLIVPTLGRIRLEKLTPAHVQRLLTQKRQDGLAAQTVVSIRNVLRTALNQALRWALISRNVATLVDAPRIERPAVRVLSERKRTGCWMPHAVNDSRPSTRWA
jgi:integrase